MLRLNRTVRSLSLADNHITDVGVAYLVDVLRGFPLTNEEASERRLKVGQSLFNQKPAELKPKSRPISKEKKVGPQRHLHRFIVSKTCYRLARYLDSKLWMFIVLRSRL